MFFYHNYTPIYLLIIVFIKIKRIILTKIKPAGKKIMSVRDYLNGVKKENLLGVMCNEREI